MKVEGTQKRGEEGGIKEGEERERGVLRMTEEEMAGWGGLILPDPRILSPAGVQHSGIPMERCLATEGGAKW